MKIYSVTVTTGEYEEESSSILAIYDSETKATFAAREFAFSRDTNPANITVEDGGRFISGEIRRNGYNMPFTVEVDEHELR